MHFALRATIILQLLNSILITALPSTNLARHHQRSPSHSTNLLKVDERDSALPSNLFKRINYLALGNIFDVVEDLGTGWVVYYNVLDFALTTVVPSDSDLIHFYSGVLSLAGNVWAGEAPSATRGASMGGISLTLESMEPIPWDFIEWFLITAVCPSHPLYISFQMFNGMNHPDNLADRPNALGPIIT